MSTFRFDPADLQRLNRLVFLPRAVSTETGEGSKRSRRSGDGGEFMDFRPYSAGDDIRRVDWSLYARLRQLFVRVNESPRQLSVMLLVDNSRSMGFGMPVSKLEQAQRIACALGFVAMRNGDRVFCTAFGEKVHAGVGPLRGARGLASLVKFLGSLAALGPSNLSDCVKSVRIAHRDRGLIVVLSDFLNVPDRDEALIAASGGGATVLVVQVLDPIDRGEGLSGKIRLRDSETGRMVDVDLDRAGLNEFQEMFEAERARFESRCSGQKRYYALASTRDNYLGVVCDVLRAKGVLK
jgi:uncharacterized protein (DUF58 family)